MQATKIQWAEKTWNPIRGCKIVSAGCLNCYAASMAHRFASAGLPYEGLTKVSPTGRPTWTGNAQFIRERPDDPLRLMRPTRIFVNSMSDLFHEDIDTTYIAAIFAVMAACPQHQFIVLTKRPELMRAWFRDLADWTPTKEIANCALDVCGLNSRLGRRWNQIVDRPWPLPNVWLGVSVESQWFTSRIEGLMATPAAVKFVSAEPLLGPIDFDKPSRHSNSDGDDGPGWLRGWHIEARHDGPQQVQNPKLDWVIVGGESGPEARWSELAWYGQIVEQCQEAGVPVFVKQLGTRLAHWAGFKSRTGSDMAEWPENYRVRQFPEGHSLAP